MQVKVYSDWITKVGPVFINYRLCSSLSAPPWHIGRHLKWYRAVIENRRVAKRGAVLLLSFCFLLVAVTGFVPWCIDGLNGAVLRKIFIEIHDKLTLIFAFCMVWHVAGRMNRLFRH
jgi:hypothetical protein